MKGMREGNVKEVRGDEGDKRRGGVMGRLQGG